MSQPISAARFPDLLSSPPEASAAWSAFSVLVVEPPAHVTAVYSDHIIGLQLSGTCRLRREMSGRSVEGWSGPGSVSIIPARVSETFEGKGHRGTSRGIALFLPEAFLWRVIAQDWDIEPRNVEIVRRFLARDPVIEGLMTRLAFEAKNGSPSG